MKTLVTIWMPGIRMPSDDLHSPSAWKGLRELFASSNKANDYYALPFARAMTRNGLYRVTTETFPTSKNYPLYQKGC
jgi:hypothetical protein